MSIQAMAWVIDHSPREIIGGEYAVMLMIANHLGKVGEAAFPTLESLADETRLSKRQTITCLQRLEAKSHLIIDRGKGRSRVSRYRIPGFESWLQKVKGVHLLDETETVKPLHPLGTKEKVKSVHLNKATEKVKPVHSLAEIKGEVCDTEKVKSATLKGEVCATPPTPPYKVEPSLTVKEPSAHARLMEFLNQRNGVIANPGKDGKDAKWLLEHFTVEECEECFDHLGTQTWRDTAVTWGTVRNEIGPYLKKHTNGNGHKPATDLDPFGQEFIRKPFTVEDAIRRSPERNADDIRLHWEGQLPWEEVRNAARR